MLQATILDECQIYLGGGDGGGGRFGRRRKNRGLPYHEIFTFKIIKLFSLQIENKVIIIDLP